MSSTVGFLLNDGLAWIDGTNTSSQRVTPDRTLKRDIKPRVLKLSFGDGYEQRAVNGINNIDETYDVSFRLRKKEEIDAIIATFTAKAGVSSFLFTIPDENATGNELSIKVVCDDFSQTYDYDDFYSCNAKLRRVYEA